jgi:hypothetical protein
MARRKLPVGCFPLRHPQDFRVTAEWELSLNDEAGADSVQWAIQILTLWSAEDLNELGWVQERSKRAAAAWLHVRCGAPQSTLDAIVFEETMDLRYREE